MSTDSAPQPADEQADGQSAIAAAASAGGVAADNAPVRDVLAKTDPTWVYWSGRFLTGSWLRTVHRLAVRGREYLPAKGGALIVANHQSFLDIPIIASAVPRHVVFVARDTLARSRFLGFVLRGSRAVLLRRGEADRSAIRQILTHLEAGDCVAVFPEGTRARDGKLAPFRAGALLAARRARVPLIPAAIGGSWRALPPGAMLPRPTKVRVTFCPPLRADGSDALEHARKQIASALGIPLISPSRFRARAATGSRPSDSRANSERPS